jgi:hypothetical protein
LPGSRFPGGGNPLPGKLAHALKEPVKIYFRKVVHDLQNKVQAGLVPATEQVGNAGSLYPYGIGEGRCAEVVMGANLLEPLLEFLKVYHDNNSVWG